MTALPGVAPRPERLDELKMLREQRLITEDESQAKRRAILEGMRLLRHPGAGGFTRTTGVRRAIVGVLLLPACAVEGAEVQMREAMALELPHRGTEEAQGRVVGAGDAQVVCSMNPRTLS